MAGIITTDKVELGLSGSKFHWRKNSSGLLELRAGAADVDTGAVLGIASASGFTGNVPAFRYHRTTNGPALPIDTVVELWYPDKVYDLLNNVGVSGSTSRFTAPVAGVYQFFAAATIATPSSSYVQLQLQLVNATYPGGLAICSSELSSSSGPYWKTCQTAFLLAAGDQIRVAMTVSGQASSHAAAGIHGNYFAGNLVRQT